MELVTYLEQRRNAVLVPGFASDGAPWRELVAPLLQAAGWQTYQAATSKRYFLRVRLCDGNIAQAIAAMTPRGAVGWGHSDGCNILRQAAAHGAPFAQLVFINPALDSDAEIASQVRVIHVWHSPADFAVKLAKLLFLHPWGDMGAKGYTGPSREPQQLWINYNKQEHMPVRSDSHTDVFEPGVWSVLGPEMLQRVELYRSRLLSGAEL